jgi:hypothetical protein
MRLTKQELINTGAAGRLYCFATNKPTITAETWRLHR